MNVLAFPSHDEICYILDSQTARKFRHENNPFCMGLTVNGFNSRIAVFNSDGSHEGTQDVQIVLSADRKDLELIIKDNFIAYAK